MPLHRCGFQLDRKTCLHSTCDGSGLGPGPPAPRLWVAVQSLPLGKAAARALRVVVGSSTYLRPPVGADRSIAPDPAKCVREGIVGSPSSRSQWRAEGRLRPASHSLGLSHHGLCVLLCRGFHTQIGSPKSNPRLHNKRFLFTETVVIRPRANRMWNRRWLHAREILF